MGRFDFEKHGYNPIQVDKYISNLTVKYEEKLAEQKDRLISLKTELDMANQSLEEFKDKDKQISKALVMAVEKAEQIEDSSKRVYGLEIKRVRLLYNRWEVLLDEIENKYPEIATTGKTKLLLKDFKDNIEDVLRQNNKFTSVRDDIKKQTNDTYIKNILNRMDYVEEKVEKIKEERRTKKIIQDVEVKVINNPKKTKSRVEKTNDLNEQILPKVTKKTYNSVDINSLIDRHNEDNNRLKNFNIPGISKKAENGNIIDKYLESEEDENNPYAKVISNKKKRKNSEQLFEFAFPEPNETGYDYRDAIHPKEDLDEIMKSFDFYTENDE